MPKAVVLSPVEHDGVLYAEGDELEIKSTKQAEELEALGVILIRGKKAAPAEEPAK